jgi:ABC-type transporter Mla subunit MlaD
VEVQVENLAAIVEQIGEAVLITTETVEHLAERVDAVANQVQQQGYQIFALCDAIQTLGENQDSSLARFIQLTETLERLTVALAAKETQS